MTSPKHNWLTIEQLAEKIREEDANITYEVVSEDVVFRCNCAMIAPTMPTCRITHLQSCPVWWVLNANVWQAEYRQVRDWIRQGSTGSLIVFLDSEPYEDISSPEERTNRERKERDEYGPRA